MHIAFCLVEQNMYSRRLSGYASAGAWTPRLSLFRLAGLGVKVVT